MRCYLFTSGQLFAALAAYALFGHKLLVTGQETNRIIDVGVYYESLCGDSMRWIEGQLLPTYPVLKDFLNVTFVPYGKARHTREEGTGLWKFSCQHGTGECEGNMAQSCAIHAIKSEEPAENVQQLTVNLIGCTMSSRYPPTAVPQCAQNVGLSSETQRSITECIHGPLSSELLARNGDKTHSLNPSLTFVPTITINGVHSRENQGKALNRFFHLICGYIPEDVRPADCN